MMNSIFRYVLSLLLLAMSSLVMGGVNLKNGNFYISYTDIVVPGGGNKLEMTRTYNSKSTEVGWFGFGWGSDYETRIVVAPDGAVVVHENGSGAETRFVPTTPINPTAATARIIEAMKKKTALTDKVARELQDKLEKDAELRNLYGNKFEVSGSIADGTTLYSNERGMQELSKTKNGFKRLYVADGRVEFFSNAGKLLEIRDKNGYSITLTYDGKNVKTIKDSQAKQLFFDWYPDGKVKSIWSVGDKKASYKYKGTDLIESEDVAGNMYRFEYDNNHNMSLIGYSDKTNMKIKYDPKTQYVVSVTERNGKETKYIYGSNPAKPDLHYWTEVKKEDFAGKMVTNKYEYEINVRSDGSQYVARILTILNDVKTETVYNEDSLPLKITRGSLVTTFEYNKKGLLTKKNSNRGEFVNLEYHPKLNKISKVVNNDGWTTFDYDDKGNLFKAVNSQGKAVLLIYDRNGRITKLVDDDKDAKKKRVLAFDYNAMGKPVKIVMEKVGEIFVDYDNYGEIKKVDSKAGPQMALQVTQAFQNLLTIVKPAGVNLSL